MVTLIGLTVHWQIAKKKTVNRQMNKLILAIKRLKQELNVWLTGGQSSYAVYQNDHFNISQKYISICKSALNF